MKPTAYLIEHATKPEGYIRYVSLYATSPIPGFIVYPLIKIDDELVKDALAFRDMVKFQIFPDFSLAYDGELIAFDKTGTQLDAVPIIDSTSTESIRSALYQLKEKL